jgi:aminoglycoside 3-N-acetyltransferase I
MTEILQLGAQDLSLMRDLNTLFADVFEDRANYTDAPPADDYLARQLERSNLIVLVAMVGQELIGGLVAYELPKLEQERSEIYIYDLVVIESRRRQGVATALIVCLQDIAKKRAAWVVYVQADYGDEPAIALYTKLGVREDVMHFDIPVLLEGNS